MIGVFDSGVGGFASAMILRGVLHSEDIVYLADRKNAPYGTKTREELIDFVSRDIMRLKGYGCRLCLIACCTASAVYPYLDKSLKEIARPIITPAARVAAKGKRIAVIATSHTTRTKAFTHEIAGFSEAAVFEICAQELVSLVESGERDGSLTRSGNETIFKVSEKIKATKPDTLVLGCTHFSHLERSFSALLPEVRIVSAAREGALALCSEIVSERQERGACLYTE